MKPPIIIPYYTPRPDIFIVSGIVRLVLWEIEHGFRTTRYCTKPDGSSVSPFEFLELLKTKYEEGFRFMSMDGTFHKEIPHEKIAIS